MSTEPKLGTCDNPRHAPGSYLVRNPHEKLDDCDDWREGESAPAQPHTRQACGHQTLHACPSCKLCFACCGCIEFGKEIGITFCEDIAEDGEGSTPWEVPAEEPIYFETLKEAIKGYIAMLGKECDRLESRSVPPAAGTAMTAGQFDENWLRSRHFFVTGCNKGALVTLDDALAYSAHVRKATRGESMTSKQLIKDADALVDEIILHTSYTGNSGERQVNRRNLVLAYAAHVREAAQSEIQQLKRDTVDIDMELSSEKEKRYAAERKLADVEKVLCEIGNAVGAPITDYASASVKCAELSAINGKVSKLIVAALASLRDEKRI